MANYNVDIAVALKGAKQLTSFNREVKATSLLVFFIETKKSIL